jgi:hypothetical protein
VSDQNWEAARRRSAGWLAFAATMLVMSGGFKVLDALWAFKFDDDIKEDVQTVIFERDPVAWGWLWLVLGLVLIAAGIAVAKGSQLARWFGVVVAGVSLLFNYVWIYFQPIWTLVSTGVLLAVLYALIVYGGRQPEVYNND